MIYGNKPIFVIAMYQACREHTCILIKLLYKSNTVILRTLRHLLCLHVAKFTISKFCSE